MDKISGHVETPPNETAPAPRRYRYSAGAEPPEAPAEAGGGPALNDAATSSGLEGLVPPIDWLRIWLVLACAAVSLLVLYSHELWELQARWSSDSGWSHGFVVPLISIFLISVKWDTLRQLTPRGALSGVWILILGVTGGVLFRATATTHMSNLSILVVLIGGVLLVFGWEYLKVLWLPIGFLGFAIPPPSQLYAILTAPMQTIAAEVGVWFLPLFGGEGVRMGTVIEVMRANGPPAKLDVEQACSGMKMLVAFFALAVALGYSSNRPMWQKVFLACCALPIAIICNALRVTLTGVMVTRVGQEWAEGNAHMYFGLLMLIPAMFMQLGIAWALDRMFVETPEGSAAPSGGLP